MRICKEPEKVVRLYREEFGNMLHQKETMRAMAALTGDERYLAVEAGQKEEKKMSCVVLDYVEVKTMIQTCQEIGVSREKTLERIMDKCKLEEEAAQEYMDKFWIK